jgi:hypothetical protein
MAKEPKQPAGGVGGDEAVQRFIADLNAAPAGDHVVHGMIKAADTGNGLMFAHPGDCDRWIFIPATAIQSIQRSGRVACQGHWHTTADIQLKDPQSDLEKAFADVASLHQAKLIQGAGRQSLFGASPDCPPGTSWKQDQWGNWGCFPGP